uniref:Sperm-tail PG-rich repeat-containing protein 2 n=2 Tax=Clastoptera arizonana TaxID=38151 RepID=A0A1B6CY95_9HEMI
MRGSKVLLYVCQPPRWRKTTPTIPEKGLLYYDFKSDGTVEKVIEQIGNTWPTPTYYNVPQGEICFNTKKYKGISWSRMKDIRFKNQTDHIPGPADYDLFQKCTPQYKLDQEKYCMRLKSTSKQEERYLDKVMNLAKREDLPGPGAYNIINPKFSKNEVSTFARAKRDDSNKLLTNPGPASYNYSCSSILKPFKYTSYKNSPFMVDSLRFPTTDKFTPGPSEYDPYKGLFYENQRKFNPMITKNIPFSTTSSRKLDSINPNKDLSPSPASYNLQKKPIRQTKVYNLFGSRAPRFLEKSSHTTQPNCASYSVEKSFNAIKNPTSHLKSKTAVFMTTIRDSKELKRTTSLPGPGTYQLPSCALNTRSCIFTKTEKGSIKITPGPSDYYVNPNVCKPNIFTTHNVTLKPDQRIPQLNWYKKLTLSRKLRCFV